MKAIKIISSLLLATACLITVSCDDLLDIPQHGVDTVDNFYNTDDHGDGNKVITVKLCEDAVSATYNSSTYSYTYTGSGKYVSVDLISASSDIDRGDFTAAESTAATKGNFIEGYDTEMWGTKFYNWGSVWGTVTDGTMDLVKAVGGTVNVSNSGDNFVITGSLTLSDGTSVKFGYTGPLAGFTAAQ